MWSKNRVVRPSIVRTTFPTRVHTPAYTTFHKGSTLTSVASTIWIVHITATLNTTYRYEIRSFPALRPTASAPALSARVLRRAACACILVILVQAGFFFRSFRPPSACSSTACRLLQPRKAVPSTDTRDINQKQKNIDARKKRCSIANSEYAGCN